MLHTPVHAACGQRHTLPTTQDDSSNTTARHARPNAAVRTTNTTRMAQEPCGSATLASETDSTLAAAGREQSPAGKGDGGGGSEAECGPRAMAEPSEAWEDPPTRAGGAGGSPVEGHILKVKVHGKLTQQKLAKRSLTPAQNDGKQHNADGEGEHAEEGAPPPAKSRCVGDLDGLVKIRKAPNAPVAYTIV